MKRKLYNSLALALVSVLALTGFTGCTKEYITEEYITNVTGTDMEMHDFTVPVNDWKWNGDMNRYECAFSFPAFDEYMFEEGAVQGWVYIWKTFGDKDYPVLSQCPYVQSYSDGEGYTYSETIGYDLYLKPEKQIVFYIQASDLSDVSEYLDEYKFKINFIFK